MHFKTHMTDTHIEVYAYNLMLMQCVLYNIIQHVIITDVFYHMRTGLILMAAIGIIPPNYICASNSTKGKCNILSIIQSLSDAKLWPIFILDIRLF